MLVPADEWKSETPEEATASLRCIMSMCSPVNLYFGGGGMTAGHWTTEQRVKYVKKTDTFKKFLEESAEDPEMNANAQRRANSARSSRSSGSRMGFGGGSERSQPASRGSSRGSSRGIRSGELKSSKGRPGTPAVPKEAWTTELAVKDAPMGILDPDYVPPHRRPKAKKKLPRHLKTQIPTVLGGMSVDPRPRLSANTEQYKYGRAEQDGCLERSNDKTHNMTLDTFMEYCEAKAKFGKVMLKGC